MSKVYTSIDQLIGHTPLLELTHFEADEDLKARVLVKLEYFNPAGSVKDRVAKNMIDEAEKAGKLVRGGDYTIIEPTSGNTGVGIASVAAARGYKVIITMPESMLARTSVAKMFSRYFSEIPCRAAISLSGMRPAAWCSARSTITRRAYLPLVETNMYSAAFRSFSPLKF